MTKLSLLAESSIRFQFPILHMVVSAQLYGYWLYIPSKFFMYDTCNCILTFWNIRIIINLHILFLFNLMKLIATAYLLCV